jgi:hypothetical protein
MKRGYSKEMSLKSRYNREVFLADPDTGVYNRRSINTMQTAFDATEVQSNMSMTAIAAIKRDYSILIRQLKPILTPKVVPETPKVEIISNLNDEYIVSWTNELFVLRLELVVDGVTILQKIDPKAVQFVATVPLTKTFDPARKFVTASVTLYNIIGPSIVGNATVNRFYEAPVLKSVLRNKDNRDEGTITYEDPTDITIPYTGIEIFKTTVNIDDSRSYDFISWYSVNGAIKRPGTLEFVNLTAHPEAFLISLRYTYVYQSDDESIHPDENCSDFSEYEGISARDDPDEMDSF